MQGLNEYQESKLQLSTQYMYLYENDLDILYAYYNDAAVECVHGQVKMKMWLR